MGREWGGARLGEKMVFILLNECSGRLFLILVSVLSGIDCDSSLLCNLSPHCCNSSEGALGRVLGEERSLASGPGTWNSEQALVQVARLPGREEGHGPTPWPVTHPSSPPLPKAKAGPRGQGETHGILELGAFGNPYFLLPLRSLQNPWLSWMRPHRPAHDM